MKSHIRQAIESSLQIIREARRDRSVPCIMGCGWTVAVKDSNSCLSIEGRDGDKVAYSFAGSWNRKSVYYQDSVARRIRARLANSRPELTLVVRHHNELRDRQEQSAIECLRACFPHRNTKA